MRARPWAGTSVVILLAFLGGCSPQTSAPPPTTPDGPPQQTDGKPKLPPVTADDLGPEEEFVGYVLRPPKGYTRAGTADADRGVKFDSWRSAEKEDDIPSRM